MILGRRRFARDRRGSVRVTLSTPERELLRALPREAQGLLERDDPAARRVFPVAYPDDARAQSEYREMMGSQLLEHHQQSLDTLSSTAGATTLDDDELAQWLDALEVLRLVLGTQLDVSEDMTVLRGDDPRMPHFALYQYLSELQQSVIDVLGAGLA